MKNKNTMATLCLFVLIAASFLSLNAQSDKYFRESERKTYILRIEDLQRGYCTFELNKDDDRYVMRSENVLYITIPETVFREKSEFSLQLQPFKYNLKMNSGKVTRNLDVEFTEEKALLKETFGRNSKNFEWDTGKDFEILDNNVMNHWYVLFKKFFGLEKDEAELKVVVPAIKNNVTVKLKKTGTEIITIEEKKYSVLRIEGELLSKSKFFGWVNAENGDLITFSLPDQKFELVASDSIYPFRTTEEEKSEVEEREDKSSTIFPEVNVEFGLSEWRIKGKLSFPERRMESYPAVILVHGSGPQDEDETIGPNKPFKEIAEGLNARGYAVLRYVKRTKEYGTLLDIESLTLEEETIEDAAEAVNYLVSRKDIDKNGIFLLGHSLGGFAAPFIAEKSEKISGLIIAAGNTRPLIELVKEQVRFQSLVAGLSDSVTQEKVDEIQETYEAVLQDDYSERKTWVGMTRKYLEDINVRNPVEVLSKLDIPALIIQGENDCQVSMEDFRGWKSGIQKAGKENVVFKSFPGINHLFMEVEGKSTGAEYMVPGKVDENVIGFIADWLDNISSR